jgi:hypothetical protein
MVLPILQHIALRSRELKGSTGKIDPNFGIPSTRPHLEQRGKRTNGDVNCCLRGPGK